MRVAIAKILKARGRTARVDCTSIFLTHYQLTNLRRISKTSILATDALKTPKNNQQITATQARNSCTTVTFLGYTKPHFPVTVAMGMIDARMYVPPSGVASVPSAINFRNYHILFYHRFSLSVYVLQPLRQKQYM